MRESVLAVLRCGGEVLAIRRSESLRAFPGYLSFPGGKIDGGESPEEALEREVEEELGLALAGSPLVLSRRERARSETPAFMPLRFRTAFHLVELSAKPPLPALPGGEVAEARWARPRDLLEEWRRGLHLAVPPTVALLRLLAAGDGPDGVDAGGADVADLSRRPDPGRVPGLEPVGGVEMLLVRSDTLPPATTTNAFLVGDGGGERVLIDPSPRDGEELARLRRSLEGRRIDRILITHHHGDHHARAPDLARERGIPVSLSGDSLARIRAKRGAGYFDGVDVGTVGEGDVLTESRGDDVVLLEVPGHDEGQLAPAASSGKWMIVGDLVQGEGSVVVGGEEGDMAKYMRSLERVAALGPAVVFPSHGMPVGGTRRIRAVLAHRRARERQVRGLLEKGMDPPAIVGALYPGLDPRLKGAAERTVRAHIDKILKEGG